MSRRKKLIKQAKINDVWFNLYVDPDTEGAENRIVWHPERPNSITIGLLALDDYAHAFELLMHEAVEAAIRTRNGTNYVENTPRNYAAYMQFAFSHETFQNVMTDAAAFIVAVSNEYFKEVFRMYPDMPRFRGEKPIMAGKK